jgi:hypothetical protein
MPSWFAKNDHECSRLRSSLEELQERNSLPPALAAHSVSCQECQRALDDLFESRALLSRLRPQPEEARPWFAARVMAAINEKESKLTRSLETWTVVPRLASKLAWGAVLALVLTTTWLAGQPKSVRTPAVRTDLAGEPVVENHPVPLTNDDVLASLTEQTE